jgi:hypothetical protein
MTATLKVFQMDVLITLSSIVGRAVECRGRYSKGDVSFNPFARPLTSSANSQRPQTALKVFGDEALFGMARRRFFGHQYSKVPTNFRSSHRCLSIYDGATLKRKVQALSSPTTVSPTRIAPGRLSVWILLLQGHSFAYECIDYCFFVHDCHWTGFSYVYLKDSYTRQIDSE